MHGRRDSYIPSVLLPDYDEEKIQSVESRDLDYEENIPAAQPKVEEPPVPLMNSSSSALLCIQQSTQRAIQTQPALLNFSVP